MERGDESKKRGEKEAEKKNEWERIKRFHS